MPRKKAKREAAADEMADLLIAHMEETLTPAQAKTMLRDLKVFSQVPHQLLSDLPVV